MLCHIDNFLNKRSELLFTAPKERRQGILPAGFVIKLPVGQTNPEHQIDVPGYVSINISVEAKISIKL